MAKRKKQLDTQQLARSILDKAVPDAEPKRKIKQSNFKIAASTGTESHDEAVGKNPSAVALGRLGGKKGGAARAAKLSAERRKEIARKAAKTRWDKRKR